MLLKADPNEITAAVLYCSTVLFHGSAMTFPVVPRTYCTAILMIRQLLCLLYK